MELKNWYPVPARAGPRGWETFLQVLGAVAAAGIGAYFATEHAHTLELRRADIAAEKETDALVAGARAEIENIRKASQFCARVPAGDSPRARAAPLLNALNKDAEAFSVRTFGVVDAELRVRLIVFYGQAAHHRRRLTAHLGDPDKPQGDKLFIEARCRDLSVSAIVAIAHIEIWTAARQAAAG